MNSNQHQQHYTDQPHSAECDSCEKLFKESKLWWIGGTYFCDKCLSNYQQHQQDQKDGDNVEI
jgi:hypothetical protein